MASLLTKYVAKDIVKLTRSVLLTIDRPKMLAIFSEALAERGLSIENITTDIALGKDGRREFHINADCVVTSYMDQDELYAVVSDLNHLKEKLNLDVVDVRVQRLAPGRE